MCISICVYCNLNFSHVGLCQMFQCLISRDSWCSLYCMKNLFVFCCLFLLYCRLRRIILRINMRIWASKKNIRMFRILNLCICIVSLSFSLYIQLFYGLVNVGFVIGYILGQISVNLGQLAQQEAKAITPIGENVIVGSVTYG